TSTGGSGTNGAITIQAADDRAKLTGVPLLGNVQVDLNETDVTIGAATIEGGAVTITATADSEHYVNSSDFGNSVAGITGTQAVDSLLQTILGIGFIAGVSVARS